VLLFVLQSVNIVSAQAANSKDEFERLKKSIRQSSYYDSASVFKDGEKAIRIARKNRSLADEALILQYYGNFHYFSKNNEEAKRYYKAAIELARKGNDFKLENATKIRRNFILSEEDTYEGDSEFKRLLTEAERNKYHENRVEALNGLGINAESRQETTEAMNYYLKGLKIAEEHNLDYLRAVVLNNIGLIKFEKRQLADAKKDFLLALKFAEKHEELRLALNLKNNLGLLTRSENKIEEAITYYSGTLINAKKLGFPIAIGVAHINLSNSFMDLELFNKAQLHNDTALYYFRKYQEFEFLGRTYLQRSSLFLNWKKFDQSLVFIDSVQQIHARYATIFNYINSFDILAQIKAAQGDYKAAYENTNQFHSLNDSLSEVNNADRFSRLQVIYGKEKVESELVNERNKNELLEKDNEIKRTRIRFVIVIGVLLVSSLLTIFYIRSVRQKRKQQAEFTRNLIRNIDEERSRISRDLHDDIGQSLSVIKSKVNMFTSNRISNLGNLEQEIGEVINHTRDISHVLHPSFLSKIGLIRSLFSLKEKTENNTEISIELDVDDRIEEITVHAKTQLYRILQEAINNTIKHAHASVIEIKVRQKAMDFIVIYKDNGVGNVNFSASNEGIGLQTIRERAAKISGSVKIDLSSKGFLLFIRFPAKVEN
jgi:signal transduction histidine kinase